MSSKPQLVAKVVLVAMVMVPPLAVAGLTASTAAEALAYAVLLVASSTLPFALPKLAWSAWLHALLAPLALFWVGFIWLVGDAPHVLTFRVIRSTPYAEILTWLEGRSLVLAILIALWIGAIAAALALKRAPDVSSSSKKACLATGLLSVMSIVVWHSLIAGTSGQKDDGVEVATRSAWPSGLLLAGIDLWTISVNRSSIVERTAVSDPVRPLPFMPVLAGAAKPGMHVVFVIGESHRADVMSPSARRDLVPGLRKRLDSGHLVEFTDVVSASNLTTYSVPAMITGTPSKELLSGVHRKPSGLGYYHKAGFFTAWLSNQADDVFAEDGWDVASYPSSLRFVPHDDVLLSKLRQVLNVGRPHTAVVLHMMGSHFDYERRYPESFRPAPSSSLHRHAYVRQNYENSVAYSADVLDRILQLTLETPHPAIVIFSSDHGENLLDDERRLIWHGGVVPPSRHEFGVATWISWNDAWASAFPQLAAQLHAISRLPLSHEQLLGIWLTVGGVLDDHGRQLPSVLNGAARDLPHPGERLVFYVGHTARLDQLQ